jgi:CRP/FNR family cyclic AMP-dependent transcriptional regulator
MDGSHARDGQQGALGGAGLDALARPYPAGAVLFEEGDPGSRMYVLRSGKVKIAKRVAGAEVTLALLGPGDFFGEMALLEKLPRSATATVLEDAKLIEVDETTFESLVRRSSEISVRLLRRLSARLREADRQIQALLAKSGSARVLETLRSLALPAGESGVRPLPPNLTREEVAIRAGLRASEADRVFDRLLASGVLVLLDGHTALSRESVLHDYSMYLELQETYDPLTAGELAELSGLPEDEVHRIVKRLLDARLSDPHGRAHAQRLADTYQTYLELKRRFEYPERA